MWLTYVINVLPFLQLYGSFEILFIANLFSTCFSLTSIKYSSDVNIIYLFTCQSQFSCHQGSHWSMIIYLVELQNRVLMIESLDPDAVT